MNDSTVPRNIPTSLPIELQGMTMIFVSTGFPVRSTFLGRGQVSLPKSGQPLGKYFSRLELLLLFTGKRCSTL